MLRPHKSLAGSQRYEMGRAAPLALRFYVSQIPALTRWANIVARHKFFSQVSCQL